MTEGVEYRRIAALERALLRLCKASEERRAAEIEWLDTHGATPAVGTPRLKAAEIALIAAEQTAREVLR